MRVYILASAKRQRCTPEFDDGRYLCVAHAIRINQTYVNWMKGNPKGILRVWMVKARFPVDILFTHWWVSMMKYDLICPPVFVCSTTETRIYIYIYILIDVFQLVMQRIEFTDLPMKLYLPASPRTKCQPHFQRRPWSVGGFAWKLLYHGYTMVIPWSYHVIPPKWWQFYSKRWW